MDAVSLFHYLHSLIIWCNESLFLIILNLLFTDSLHFPSVFTHGFIQLFFNVMNRIKIINQVWLGLIFRSIFKINSQAIICFLNSIDCNIFPGNLTSESVWLLLTTFDSCEFLLQATNKKWWYCLVKAPILKRDLKYILGKHVFLRRIVIKFGFWFFCMLLCTLLNKHGLNARWTCSEIQTF